MLKFAKSTYNALAWNVPLWACSVTEQLDMCAQSQDEVWVWQWAQNLSEGKGSEVKVIFRLILVWKGEGCCMKFKLIIPFDLSEYVCEWVFPFFWIF